MDKLLTAVLDAHGLQGWARTTRLTPRLSLVQARADMAAAGRDVSEDDREHSANQVFYYDDAFMQRRVDYSPDVTGNLRSPT